MSVAKRLIRGLGGSVQSGQGHAEDGVGAQTALVRGAVELDHGLIESALIGSVHADDLRSDLLVHGLDGVEHTLALVNSQASASPVEAPDGTRPRP